MSELFCRWSLLSMCLVSTAQAGVLLEKVTYPGFVMPSYSISKNCAVHDNGQLVMQYQLNGMNSKRTVPLQLSRASIKANIAEAATGTITSGIFPSDAGTVIYRAYQKQADGTVNSVLLYEENGGSGVTNINDAESAIALRNFIDVNCGDDLRY